MLLEGWCVSPARVAPGMPIDGSAPPVRKGSECAANATTARGSHPACYVCGAGGGVRLGLRFTRATDGSVSAEFACDALFQGYPDCVHGGIIAALLDGAMTHCLFGHGIAAVTARLRIRFARPVHVGAAARVRAALQRASPPGYLVQAELWQAGERRASAEGLFVARRPTTHAAVSSPASESAPA